ncbi:hypothetical protein V2J09_018349 [Rumex salicifolius]
MEVLIYNRTGTCRLKHIRHGAKQSSLSVVNSAMLPLRFPYVNHAISENFCKLRITNSLENSSSSIKPQCQGSIGNSLTVSNESYRSYVIDSEEGRDETLEGQKSVVAKILIPGLPDDSKGASIISCFWEWKPMLNVHYEKSGCGNHGSPPVLFLPGFGVDSFHYQKQMKDLGLDFRVWALDFLGQGMSLPTEDPAPLSKEEGHSPADAWGFGEDAEPWAQELAYSIDLWKDQVRYFIEEVVGEPVYIVGNSLGGWQKISDPKSIIEVLNQVYADHSTNFDGVFSKILETAEHPAASAAFTSIMFAPKGELSFTESLSRCREKNIPLCLMYGKEDPWVKPIWGRQVKQQVPDAPYYEISPAGHCPHDEVPESRL